jgi:hypothetical protein
VYSEEDEGMALLREFGLGNEGIEGNVGIDVKVFAEV